MSRPWRIDEGPATSLNKRLQWEKLRRFEVPVLVVCWALGYAPALPSGRLENTAWIRLTLWGAAHGFGDLKASALIVTVAVTFSAVLGASLRIAASLHGRRGAWPGARQVGLAAVCAPLCVVLSPAGALAFLGAVVAVAFAGWLVPRVSRYVGAAAWAEPWWNAILRECFALLSACCFLLLSWEYNAQWLQRGLLVAAGISLMARAALPKN